MTTKYTIVHFIVDGHDENWATFGLFNSFNEAMGVAIAAAKAYAGSGNIEQRKTGVAYEDEASWWVQPLRSINHLMSPNFAFNDCRQNKQEIENV